ncbi:MAG: ribosome maturation factor RimP [Gammaproteobacteria bacterium]
MHRQNQALFELFEPEISGLGYELLGLEMGQNGRGSLLRVYIDKDDGITLDDCVLVSQQLTGLLDVEDPIQGKYDLEVSSPGLDRPLFSLTHFERFTGATVKLKLHTKLNERRRIVGVIIAVENDNVLLDCDNEELVVPFSLIEQARLVPEI